MQVSSIWLCKYALMPQYEYAIVWYALSPLDKKKHSVQSKKWFALHRDVFSKWWKKLIKKNISPRFPYNLLSLGMHMLLTIFSRFSYAYMYEICKNQK